MARAQDRITAVNMKNRTEALSQARLRNRNSKIPPTRYKRTTIIESDPKCGVLFIWKYIYIYEYLCRDRDQ